MILKASFPTNAAGRPWGAPGLDLVEATLSQASALREDQKEKFAEDEKFLGAKKRVKHVKKPVVPPTVMESWMKNVKKQVVPLTRS